MILLNGSDPVEYENEPDVDRPLFPNIPVGLTEAQTLEMLINNAVTVDNANSVKELTNEDLNNITEPGSYSMKAGNTVTHKPNTASVSAKVIVFALDNGLYQFYLQGGSTSAPWSYRIKYGTSWGSWYAVANATVANNRLKFEKINITASEQSKSTTLTKDSFNLFLLACPTVTQNNGLALYYNYNNASVAGGVLHACSAITVTRDGLNVLFTKASSASAHACYILKITTA